MEIIYSPKAQNDLLFWKKSGRKNIQSKITSLIEDIVKHPKTGIGFPEELKHELSGRYSRRINLEHRIIYTFDETHIYIHSLRGHY